MRASQCALGASVPSFAVAANLTALEPLSTAQITEMLHSAAKARTTAMGRKEPGTAPIELLRIVVHSAFLSFLITTVVSLKHQLDTETCKLVSSLRPGPS
jgi:hypothetical protein